LQPGELPSWLQERLPAELCNAPPHVTVYDDEIVITLTAVDVPDAGTDSAERRVAEQAAIARLREASRPLRIKLAREIQRAAGLPVAWALRVGASEILFTSRTAPVMTRLNRREREVLDTLVAIGIAETRSAALAYVVRTFAAEHAAWMEEARQALRSVEAVRARLRHTPRAGKPEIDE